MQGTLIMVSKLFFVCYHRWPSLQLPSPSLQGILPSLYGSFIYIWLSLTQSCCFNWTFVRVFKVANEVLSEVQRISSSRCFMGEKIGNLKQKSLVCLFVIGIEEGILYFYWFLLQTFSNLYSINILCTLVNSRKSQSIIL